MLSALLDDFKDALMSGCSGTSRPTSLQAGGMWIDTTNQTAPDYYWAFKIFDGTVDIEVFRVSILSNFGGVLNADDTFSVQRYSADTVGPILELIKNRISNNGQVLSGDVLAELKFTGRTDTSTNPVSAILRFTSTDDMTSSASGGTFSMYSTPDGDASLSEHIRFIDGLVETIAPHKLNSQVLASQNVATTASIAQLSATKILAEMTGSTATDIYGIDSAGESKVLIIHNRSTAEVTLKNQDAGAAASDRLKLPSGEDYIIIPESTAILQYSTTDSRWKIRSTVLGQNIDGIFETIYQRNSTWVSPITGLVKITAHRKTLFHYTSLVDSYGNIFGWGDNFGGQIGDGTLVEKSSPVLVIGGLSALPQRVMYGDDSIPYTRGVITKNGSAYLWGNNQYGNGGGGDSILSKSSPVAVLGGLKFVSVEHGGFETLGLDTSGSAYGWGLNFRGNLGLGDVISRSSPVLVLGGFRFDYIFRAPGAYSTFAIRDNGALYGWGYNSYGQLGVGDLTDRSSPVAVLGGLSFRKITTSGNSGSIAGITDDGDVYSWGRNYIGQLGVGDDVDRSSPVLVIGGHTFKDIYSAGGEAFYGLKENGELYSWGRNQAGQLGVGDITPRSSPVLVVGGLLFKEFFSGSSSSVFALTADGTLYAWGINNNYNLGTGDQLAKSSPVAVLGGLKFTNVFASSQQTYGMCTDGKYYSWGVNNSGELGVGDLTNRSSPVAVISGVSGDHRTVINSYVVRVEEGVSYPIHLSKLVSSFGTTIMDYDLDYITIAYEA